MSWAVATIASAAIGAARRWGSPLYLYDLPHLAADADLVADAFPDPWLRLYALKANGLPALVEAVAGRGFGASAVSRGELDLAERAGFEVGRTALEGIGKGDRELARVVELASVGTPLLWTSLESADEAAALGRLAAAAGVRLDVLVRLNPGVTPETHGGLAVGAAESKFGVLPSELEAVIRAGGGAGGPLRWRGIHLHVGSQLGAVDAWRSAVRLGLRVLTLQRGALADFDTLDVGSGFPVDYGVAGSVPGPARFSAALSAELAELPADARPSRLAVEPGRAVVAGCGWLVARVLHVRERERRLIVLDAGMTELIRPALYGAEHPIVALTSMGIEVTRGGASSAEASAEAGPEPGAAPGAEPRPFGSRHRAGEAAREGRGPAEAVAEAGAEPRPFRSGHRAGAPPLSRVRVDGPICESTDRLGEADLPPLRRGDLVAIGVAGAYGSSMASTYNGRPRPPEVAWDGERLRLLRPRGRLGSLP